MLCTEYFVVRTPTNSLVTGFRVHIIRVCPKGHSE